MSHTLGRLAAVALVTTTALAIPATAPAAQRVPVAPGSYGYAKVNDQDFLGFTVRNRRIIDPRFSIEVECRHSDGTRQSVAYGPAGAQPDRRFRINANADGRVTWIQRRDPSLIPNARITMVYRFPGQGRPKVNLMVEADYTQADPAGGTWRSQCVGIQPFRLKRGPLPQTDPAAP